MFEIEIFICIKMYLPLNNPQSLMCNKTKPNKTKPILFSSLSVLSSLLGIVQIGPIIIALAVTLFLLSLFFSFENFSDQHELTIFPGVWVIASFLKSPGLFSVFGPILVMLYFEWSHRVLWFPSFTIPLHIFEGLLQDNRLQLLSPCSKVFQISSNVL